MVIDQPTRFFSERVSHHDQYVFKTSYLKDGCAYFSTDTKTYFVQPSFKCGAVLKALGVPGVA
jgi:hypothetical protein